MRRFVVTVSFVCVLVFGAVLRAPAQSGGAGPVAAEQLFAETTRPGVTLRGMLIVPEHPKAAVILLAGGNGNIGVSTKDGRVVVGNGGNFLVRSRQLFAAEGLVVLVLDAPSDRASGMDAGFRLSDRHVEDLRFAALVLVDRFKLKPWLVGTSMGSLSAAWGASHLGGVLGGVVLTSSVSKVGKRHNPPAARVRGTLDADLRKIAMPALVVRHADDSCVASDPADGVRILEGLSASPRKRLMTFEGGFPAESDACEAKSAHGYLGIEQEVVRAIAAFIKEEAAAAN